MYLDLPCCAMMWCDVMCHDVMWLAMMWHDVTWCYMMLHDVTWYFMIWRDVPWCDVMYHDVMFQYATYNAVDGRWGTHFKSGQWIAWFIYCTLSVFREMQGTSWLWYFVCHSWRCTGACLVGWWFYWVCSMACLVCLGTLSVFRRLRVASWLRNFVQYDLPLYFISIQGVLGVASLLRCTKVYNNKDQKRSLQCVSWF